MAKTPPKRPTSGRGAVTSGPGSGANTSKGGNKEFQPGSNSVPRRYYENTAMSNTRTKQIATGQRPKSNTPKSTGRTAAKPTPRAR